MVETEKEKIAEEKSKLYLEKLRKNQGELKKAQRLGRIGNWDWDMATDTITWSDEYYRIMNFDPKKHPPKYKEHLKIYTPESAARLDAAVKRNTKTGEPYELDLEIADPKNPTHWITARSETIRDTYGKIIGLRGTAQDITARKIAEEKLKASEKKYRAFVESSLDCIKLFDPQGNLLFINHGGLKEHRIKSLNEALKMGWKAIESVIPEDQIKFSRALQDAKEGKTSIIEIRHTKEGSVREACEETIIPIKDANNKVVTIFGVSKDITARKRAEEEILKKDRLLKTISEVNQIIFKEKDKEKLLNKICEIIKEYSYKMVWIGLCDEKTKSIIPIAQAGFNKGYLKTIKIKYDSSKYGHGPTGTAVRTKKPNIMRDIASDPRYAPWKKQALKRGFSSSMALPIFLKEKVIGAMSVYSEKKDSFNSEEINLLTELTGDISIALEKFESEEKNKEAEEALKESEEKYRNVTEKANDGIVVIQDQVIKYGNHALEEIRGDSLKNMINHYFLEYIAPEEKEKIKDYYIRRLKGEKINSKYETILLRKEEDRVWVELNVGIIQYGGKPAELVIIRDITERKKAEEKLKINSLYARGLIEADLDPLVTIGKEGKISDVNKATEKVTGICREKLIGTDFSNYFTDSKKAEEGYKKVFEEGQIKDYPLSIKNKSGEITDVLYNAVVFKDNLGNVQGVFAAARDITERKGAEEKLKENEEKFRSIFEHSAVGVSIVSLEGKWLQVNKSLCTMTGYSEEELLSKGYLQLTFPEDVEKTKKLTIELLSGNKNYGYLEKRYLTKDKKVIWVYLSVAVVRDLNNKPQYFVVHTEDITERKESQEKKYRALFENASDAIFIADPKTKKLIDCNKVAEKLTRYSKEKILSMYADELHPQDRVKETMKAFQKQFTRKLKTFLTEILTKDKKRIPVSVNASLVKIGNTSYSQGIFRDISEEIKVKETEEKYKSIVDSMKQGLYMTKEGHFVMVNKAMSNIFGYSEQELIGMEAWSLAKLEIRKEVREKFFNKVKNKDYTPEIVECVKKDGTKIIAEISVNESLEGEVGGLITDITLTKQADIAKTEFISAISHELRTPITPIKAQLQRILSTKLDEKEQQESIEIALRNTIRMDRLIQDLLEINRIRAGRFNIFKRKENLNEIIQETIVDLNSFAKEKNTKIIFNEGKLPEINLDKDRILEVIINIIDNAIKYGKGKILIETKKEGENILVKIKDNGIGISKEESEMIFTPFYRAKKTEIVKYGGTGLGLSISKGIVEAHGGKIWFESKEEETTFFIKIPIK